ncbi:hypothetical protein JXJ21_05035 [candidate division KSB1 bacterium]|nr:hypothetical protein [candidate division KSB1 bacterium]
MKRFALILCFLSVLRYSAGDCTAQQVDSMKVIVIQSTDLIADKGHDQGILENTVWDVRRIDAEIELHIGIAVVRAVAANTCTLRTFPVEYLEIQQGDRLITNPSGTSILGASNADEFWQKLENAAKTERLTGFSDGMSFEKTRIKLKSGEELKVKKFIVKQNREILITSRKSIHPKVIDLTEIESIRKPTMHYALFGAIIGTAIGSAAFYLMPEQKVTSDTLHYYEDVVDYYGRVIDRIPHQKVQKNKSGIRSSVRVGTMTGCVLIGTIVGSFIKGGWTSIYPREQTEKKVSLQLHQFNNHHNSAGIKLSLKF